jgi:DNA-binding response OmpR family regulator
MLIANSGPHVIRQLRERIEELESEIAELKATLGALDGHEDARELGLTRSEGKIYNALRRRKIATRDQLFFALYADNPDKRAESDPACVRVFIQKIRRKGIPVKGSKTVGWWLERGETTRGVESAAMNG